MKLPKITQGKFNILRIETLIHWVRKYWYIAKENIGTLRNEALMYNATKL